jgi:hypothetical protein
MDYWQYTNSYTGDICLDLAGLITAATVLHVLAEIQPRAPDPKSPLGWCLDSALSRIGHIHSSGDETEAFEMYMPQLEALAEKRRPAAIVQILVCDKNDS